jgi:hypothetical protein
VSNIDFLLIIGFIIFTVLRALDESNKKKQEHARRATGQQPGSAETITPRDKPNLSGEFSPPIITLPWEEESDEIESEEDKTPIYTAPQPTVVSQPPASSPSYALKLTDQQIWQGIVWSEILGEPRCRRRHL